MQLVSYCSNLVTQSIVRFLDGPQPASQPPNSALRRGSPASGWRAPRRGVMQRGADGLMMVSGSAGRPLSSDDDDDSASRTERQASPSSSRQGYRCGSDGTGGESALTRLHRQQSVDVERPAGLPAAAAQVIPRLLRGSGRVGSGVLEDAAGAHSIDVNA